jgi:RHS repeat-associated protein
MKPGAQDNGSVQLATGNVSFPVRLFSLAGHNGLDFELAISYNSGGIHKIVDTSNLEAPTGLLGLGWSLPKEAIIRNTNGTGTSEDDVYYLLAGGNLYPLFRISLTDMTEGEGYECENYNFWKIRYLRNRELWTVTKENGDRYSYGGELPTSAGSSRSSVGNSIEWGVKWKNWIGPSDVAVGQEQFPIVWNLTSIENIWNERVSFEYDQTQRLTGTVASPSRRHFTKSCRLARVTGACGDTIVLKYNEKESKEYQQPDKPPTAAHNNVCRIVGTLTTRDWLPQSDPRPRVTVTVTGKNKFTQTFTAGPQTTSTLSMNFDLCPDAPDALDIEFQAEHVPVIGSDQTILSGRFPQVIVNGGIVQRYYNSINRRRRAALKLSYVREQPAATDDADIYQHRQETHYLASVELCNAQGVNIERSELGYKFLGGGVMRVLASITHSIRAKNGSFQPSGPSHLFESYGEVQSDGVSGVVRTGETETVNEKGRFSTANYDYKLFNDSSGAFYGALKAYTSPEGSKTSYRYQQLTIDQARRELEIKRPQNDSPAWQGVDTYFGSDYAVVIWKGSNEKAGRVYATVYQWHGRWVAADLGELPTGVNGVVHVEVAAEFFAIVAPGIQESLRLFSPNKLRPGQWDTYAPTYFSKETVRVASGRNFLAVLDTRTGYPYLHRFIRDGDSWRAEWNEPIGGGKDAVLAMAARDNFIVTARATADNSSLPELRLYYLDELRNWWSRSLQVSEHFFEKNGYEWDADSYENKTWSLTSQGTKALELYAGETFLLLQAACEVNYRTTIFGSFGPEEYYNVYRHFIFRWPEDYARLELEFEPCLDVVSKGVKWDCIKRHDTEVVIKKKAGLVRPSVIGDQIIIDVWEEIDPIEKVSFKAKQKKFVYQYSGCGWYEEIFDNDQVQNNYVGLNSFSTTQNGCAQYREFNPSKHGWQTAMPTYRDGNPSLFEKLVWPLIKIVGGLVTLPLNFASGLLVEFLFLNTDLLIESMTKLGGVAQGTDQFFSANFTLSDSRLNNLVYHRSSTGLWQPVGDLTPEPDFGIHKSTGRKSGLANIFEDHKLDHANTQFVENAIICTLERDQYAQYQLAGTLPQGHATQPGFPKYQTRVQLFKNGVFFKTIDLPEGELVRHAAEDTNLTGANAFFTFKGNPPPLEPTVFLYPIRIGESLQEAIGLKLYRVINDDIQGPLTDFAVSQVTVNDGYSETHTHYTYDTATASMAPTGTGALYGKVTTTYSGASAVLDKSNGFTESLLHGPDNAASATPQNSPDDESALYKGLLYQTTVFNHQGAPVATNTTRWKAFNKILTLDGKRTGYFVRSVATTATIDGATKRTEVDYSVDAATAIGTPVEVRNFHYDVTGKPVKTIESFTYGWQKYPALLAQNVLTPVVETRTHVNEIVTAASATTWGRANGTSLWAPIATYYAQRSPGDFDFEHPERNPDWLASSRILARDAFGVVTETQDVDGIVQSAVYDKQYRLPVATFVHASVERHEAGYCGFEPYEQSAPVNPFNGVLTGGSDLAESGNWNDAVWQIDGSREQNAHTGVAALSGRPARIEPKHFAPRSGHTGYIISVWVKPRIGGRGGEIGFVGGQTRTITADKDDWQYVELITETPSENQKPFVSCDGMIDDFRFGPLYAPFNATVYDPEYHLVTARLDSNEGVLRMVYDHLQRPLATLGPDGQVVSVQSERLSRQGAQAFNPREPNQTLTILPRTGGRYYRNFAEYAVRANDPEHADPIPQGTNKGLRFGLAPVGQPSPGARSRFAVRFGAASVNGYIKLSDDQGSFVLDALWCEGMPELEVISHSRQISSFLLLLTNYHVYCFIDGTLSFRGAIRAIEGIDEARGDRGVPPAPGALVLQWTPAGNAALVDLLTFYDPIVSSAFSDGLGRVVQTQHLAAVTPSVLSYRGGEAIAEQTLYDGWGNAAVQTKPVPIGPGFVYDDQLASDFDWKSGVMRGLVDHFYDRSYMRVVDQQKNDNDYAYIRQVAESSPLARIVESGGPGAEFKPGAPHSIKHAFGQTSQATQLLTDLGLSSISQHYKALINERALDDTRRTTGVEIFDLQGSLIASRQGSGSSALTSSYGVQFTRDGAVAKSELPNAFSADDSQAKDRYTRTLVTNFRGLLKQSSDCDRGTQHYIYDRAGRLRFRRDPSGANDQANRILYWKYDPLGRITEEGQTAWSRDDEALQSTADTAPEWPDSSTVIPGDQTSWRKRYFYDISPNGGANVKGRLSRAVSRHESGEEIEETYQYDPYGRVNAVSVRVPAFDDLTRTTTYRYDVQGNVVEIGYPTGVPGPVPIGAVHYAYTSGGQLADIGTADDPAFYAAYEYNVDGSVKTEWLNQRRIQRDYSYDFQGRLVKIEDRSPGQAAWFAEALSYRDASGRFKDGNIVQASFSGSAFGIPHRYVYEYDEHGRLLSAKATVLPPQTTLAGNWDIEGIGGKPIGYDANGNIVNITQRGTAQKYFYEPGTNQLAGTDQPLRASVLSFEPHELGRFHDETAHPGEFRENEWYCRGINTREYQLTDKDKHSGTQSLQLGYLLRSRLRASSQASRYVFRAWVKNNMPDITKAVDIAIVTAAGNPLVRKRVPPTKGDWQLFECSLENKDIAPDTVLEAQLHNTAGRIDPHYSVYVDDVFFGVDRGSYLQYGVFSFEPYEAGRLHAWVKPSEFRESEWYYRNSVYEDSTEIALTKKDKHSGTQSLQLNYRLGSRLRASPLASRYVFKAWVKSNLRDAKFPVKMEIATTDGKVLVDKPVPYTEGEWRLYECAVESMDVAADTVLQALLSNPAGGRIDPHFPVYVDDVFFGIDTADYVYDASGRMIRGGHLRQLQYEPLTGLTWEIQAESPSGASRQTCTVKLRYGAQGQRVLKTAVSKDSSESASERRTMETKQTTLYLHGTNAYPLCEQSRARHHTTTERPAGGSGMDHSEIGSAAYVYGLGGLIAMHEGQQTYFFCKDHLGSLRVVLDQDNHVRADFYYQPFGELIMPNSESVQRFHYLYTGQEFDRETGLYNYRARMYDPSLGRFYAPDPGHQYASPYEYVGNNPISVVDPTGTFGTAFLRFWGKYSSGLLKNVAIGAGVGAVAGGISAGIVAAHDKTSDAGQIAWSVFIEAFTGAIASGIGSGVGYFVDVGITKLYLKSWSARGVDWSKGQIRAWGALKGAISGSVSGAVSQAVSNLQGGVDWGVSMGLAVGMGLVGGVIGGPVGATRMRVGKYYIESNAPAHRSGRYSVKQDLDYHISAPGRDWSSMIADTIGERWSVRLGAGLGLLGGVGSTALTEWAIPQK